MCVCFNKILTNILSLDMRSISFERQAISMGPGQKMGRELSGPTTEEPQL
jgi:hypothetical protein